MKNFGVGGFLGPYLFYAEILRVLHLYLIEFFWTLLWIFWASGAKTLVSTLFGLFLTLSLLTSQAFPKLFQKFPATSQELLTHYPLTQNYRRGRSYYKIHSPNKILVQRRSLHKAN